MKQLSRGRFYGTHQNCLNYSDLVLTETEYTHDFVDWHYHEQPYFTFLLEGGLYEANKKEEYYLKPGDLVFHNWQDAHYNKKPDIYTRGFHIELTEQWFNTFDLSSSHLEGSFKIKHPYLIQSLHKIVNESRCDDRYSKTSIELLLADGFNYLNSDAQSRKLEDPLWVKQLVALLHEAPETCTSLETMAAVLNVHPVHISRVFPKYFNCTLGDYLRALRLNKAMRYLQQGKHSLTEIAYLCDYSDQSHFTRSFKKVYGCSPRTFKKSNHVKRIQV